MYDTIVIGGGPAGVTSAIYTKRAGLDVLIIAKGYGTLENVRQIENYYGFETISGKELYEKGINQAKKLNIDIIEDEVTQIEKKDYFSIITPNSTYVSKTVILATGANRKKANIKGVREFEGKGISYCAICDAFFYKNKKVAVLGNGNYALSEVMKLTPVAESVCLLTNGERPVENRSISVQINEKPIKEIRGYEKVEEVTFEDNSTMKVSGIFIALGTASSLDLARKIGVITSKDAIKIDEAMQTNVSGLYACGDCTGGLLQISKAVYEGAKAGLSAVDFLKKNK